MSEFKNKSITVEGMGLLAEALAGGKLEFTKIELGCGDFAGDVSEATELVELKQTLPITKITRKGSQAILSVSLKAEDIKEDFEWKEVGVYAKTNESEEALYMYGYTENSSYISKDALNEKLINISVMVGKISEVTAVIDESLIYLTAETLNVHNMDQEAHKDIRAAISNIDLSSVNNHTSSIGEDIATHITDTKQSISNELTANKTELKSAITSTQTTLNTAITNVKKDLTTTINSMNTGDICNKKLHYERVTKNVTSTGEFADSKWTSLINYTNAKGGFVRYVARGSYSTQYIKIVVDGTTLYEGSWSILFGNGSSYSNGYFTFIDIPFTKTFQVYAQFVNGGGAVEYVSQGLYYINK